MFTLFKQSLPKIFREPFIKKSLFNFSSRSLSTHNFYRYEAFEPVSNIFSEIDQLKEKINLAQKHLDPDLRSAIHRKLKLHWTYHSNAIEGNTLTLGDTIFFLEHGLTVEGKPLKDFLDAKNHAEALDYFYSIVTDKHQITPYLIKEINSLLLASINYTPAIDPDGKPINKRATPGVYKTLPNHVLKLDGTIHRYVEPIQVASEMDNLFNWINSAIDKKHPIITSSIAHYNMVRIHPFDDGNGRGARILMNLILMKKHYPPAIIKIEKRKEYLDSLNKADKGDIMPFIKIVSGSLLETEKIILAEIETNSIGSGNKSKP